MVTPAFTLVKKGKAKVKHAAEFTAAAPRAKHREKGVTAMLEIRQDADCQTVLTTFEVTPGTSQDVLDLLTEAYRDVISKQPGFIASALHVNDAQTRIANYSQWRRREDFQAMLRSDEMRARNRRINELCKGFEPVMYDVTAVL